MYYPILLIGENEQVLDELKIYLERQFGKIKVEQVSYQPKGKALLDFHGPEILCSILGEGNFTVPLAMEMEKRGFPRIIISFSENPDLQKQQMEYCTHCFKKTEWGELRNLIEILIPDS